MKMSVIEYLQRHAIDRIGNSLRRRIPHCRSFESIDERRATDGLMRGKRGRRGKGGRGRREEEGGEGRCKTRVDYSDKRETRVGQKGGRMKREETSNVR